MTLRPAARALPLVLLLALGACGAADDVTPGGLSPGDSRELDAAAAAIDVNAMDNMAATD